MDFLWRFPRIFLPLLTVTGLILDPLPLLIHLLWGRLGLPRRHCHAHEVVELSSSLLAAHPLRLPVDRPLVHQVSLYGLSGLVGHRLLLPESLSEPLLLRLAPSDHPVEVLHQRLLHRVPSSLHYPIKVLLAQIFPCPRLLTWIPYAHDFLLKGIQKAQLLLKLLDLLQDLRLRFLIQLRLVELVVVSIRGQ